MNDPKNQKSQFSEEKRSTNASLRNIHIALNTLTNELKTQRTEQQKQPDWPKRTAKAAIAYTVITLIIMLIGAYQSYLTRQATIVSQRAFVSVGLKSPFIAAVPSGGPIAQQGILQTLVQGNSEIGGLNYVVELTNSGNSGTKDLLFIAKCVSSSIGDLPDPWPLLQGTKNLEKTPQYIGPHSSNQTICGFDIDQVIPNP